jgi:hypothetical protein
LLIFYSNANSAGVPKDTGDYFNLQGLCPAGLFITGPKLFSTGQGSQTDGSWRHEPWLMYFVSSSKALPFSSLLSGSRAFLKSFQEFTLDISDLKFIGYNNCSLQIYGRIVDWQKDKKGTGLKTNQTSHKRCS